MREVKAGYMMISPEGPVMERGFGLWPSPGHRHLSFTLAARVNPNTRQSLILFRKGIKVL